MTHKVLSVVLLCSIHICTSKLSSSYADDTEKRLQLIQKKYTVAKQLANSRPSRGHVREKKKKKKATEVCPGAPEHSLPSLLFLGLAHSGTTSLSILMDHHSELSYGAVKEHNFWQLGVEGRAISPAHYNFTGKELTATQSDFMDGRQAPRTLDEYMSGFNSSDESCDLKYFFDGDVWTVYLANDTYEDERHVNKKRKTREALQRIQHVKDTLGGDLKLLMMLRDPYDVVLSMSAHCDSPTNKNSTVCESICSDVTCLQTRAEVPELVCPAESIRRWQTVFPNKDNWLFLRSEDFFNDSNSVLDRVWSFSNVSKLTYTTEEMEEMENGDNGGRRRVSSPLKDDDDARREFHESPTMQECRSALEDVTGLVFDTWGPDA